MEHYGYSRSHLTALVMILEAESAGEGDGEQGGPGSARYVELDANFPLIVFHQWRQKFS